MHKKKLNSKILDNLSKLNVPVFVKPYLDNEIPDATDFSFFIYENEILRNEKGKIFEEASFKVGLRETGVKQ